MDDVLRTRTVRLPEWQIAEIQTLASAVYAGNFSFAARDVIRVGLDRYAEARDEANRRPRSAAS